MEGECFGNAAEVSKFFEIGVHFCFGRLSHFVPCQSDILPSLAQAEHFQSMEPSSVMWLLMVPWQPFIKHRISDERSSMLPDFVVSSIMRAMKLNNFRAAAGISFGILPDSSRPWRMLVMYMVCDFLREFFSGWFSLFNMSKLMLFIFIDTLFC